MNSAKDIGTPSTGKLPVKGTVTMVLQHRQGPTSRSRSTGPGRPAAAASFAHLARKNFLNGSTCHRLVSGGIFVLQCGDPNGDGTGGPPYQFADENLAQQADGVYERGVVAMANSGPDTNGSQFFINYKDGQLQNAYTPFGVVTKGMAIVDAIAAAGTDSGEADGRPRSRSPSPRSRSSRRELAAHPRVVVRSGAARSTPPSDGVKRRTASRKPLR
jgi:peptidyl-prolyl cis-trans isomerase B (cyclophilin B)